MANDVEIRVTGDDDSGKAFASATANAGRFKIAAKDAGGAAKLLGTDLSAAAREADRGAAANLRAATAARQLDREIEDAAEGLRQLRIEQALADRGSGDFVDRIREQEKALTDLKRARSQIGSADFKLIDLGQVEKQGQEAGQTFGRATLLGIGTAARNLGPIGTAFGVGIGLQVASVAGPLITAGIGGAIIAGAGIGIAGLGIALVKGDARIRAAGTKLATGLREGFAHEAHVLINPVLDSLDQLGAAGRRIMPSFGRMFANVAPSVRTLTGGIIGLVEQALPGLEAMSQAVGPVISRISSELPGFGAALSDMMSSIADAAPGAAEGIGDLIDTMGFFVRAAGFVIETGSNMYSIFKGLITLDWGQIKSGITGTHSVMKDLRPEQESWLEILGESKAAVVDYAAAIREMSNAQLASENSAIAMEEAIDKATAAAKNNKKGIDANTESGRNNRSMLLRLAATTNSYVEDLRRTGASANAMTGAMNRGRAAFIAVARSMGASKAEAERLANSLFRLDGINVTPTVDVRVLGASRLRSVEATINRLNRGNFAFAHGGIKGAQNGATSSGLTWVGEHGPELLDLPPGTQVHSNPDSERIAQQAQGGSGGSVVLELHGGMGELERALVRFITDRVRIRGGGSVQLAFGGRAA